jgi:RNA polymerase sigma-70 factor
MIQFAKTVAESFCIGQSYYGDVDVSLDLFHGYMWTIARKHLQDSSDEPVIVEFTRRLYVRDLYLACGCVYSSDKAWTTFDSHYRRFINNLVRLSYRHGTDTEEIADTVLVSLYLHDRSGRQRIASYDGRSSLATWLRVIVLNRAINEGNERMVASSDDIGNVPDRKALQNLESALLADRYSKVLSESLSHALREITATERLMLLWRYEQNLQLGEIAHLMGIHQSNVTRQLLRLQAKLRAAVIETLASQYQMSSSAIQECLADVVENPQSTVSLMSLIKETRKPVTGATENGLPRAHTAKLANVAEQQ